MCEAQVALGANRCLRNDLPGSRWKLAGLFGVVQCVEPSDDFAFSPADVASWHPFAGWEFAELAPFPQCVLAEAEHFSDVFCI